MAKVKRTRGRRRFAYYKELGGAPNRAALSKTARVLLEGRLIRGRVLDYGCGRGYDADAQGWDAFDPYYRPTLLRGPYDTIIVNHVVNVLTRDSRIKLYSQVQALLSNDGVAYLSVARNIPKIGKAGVRQRLQNYVILTLPSVYADVEEEIYELKNGAEFADRTLEFEERGH
jgi:ATP adenylyltransferase